MQAVQTLLSNASPVQLGAAATALICVVLVYAWSTKIHPSSCCYPKGPPRLPLLGNSHNFPTENWGVIFNEWHKLYGDIVYVQLPGMPFYIINSLEIAQELFNKRAKLNSERRIGYMIMNLMGWSWLPAFMSPDALHGRIRTLFRRGIGPTKMPSKDPLIERKAQDFVLDLQGVRGNPKSTVLNTVGMIIIELAYGRGIVKEHGDEMIALNLEAMNLLEKAILTVWTVDLIPLLRFWPSWMPGGEFKRSGAYCKQLVDRIRQWPFQMAIERHKAGTLDHCFADDLMNEFGTSFEVRDTLANIYFAGVDTTSTLIIRFLHTMFIYPEVTKKMQSEIDSVVGRDRSPTVKDRNDLPYSNAVWKEAIRYKCSMPLGIPHSSNEDQLINGYFIPKGSIINPNFGSMLSDPNIWGDPDVFRPERFLSSDASALPDPTTLIFGFGPRICPGMYFADRTGFHLVIAAMALFDINPLPGESVPHPTKVQYLKRGMRLPVKFDCVFTPRDDKARQVLSSLALSR
ncbi:SubName: Full=Uncharacterized protein {ECO:0000313/EMBL:CCA72098.1} [Serendipita indica DSM 11827]|nr:SubName: Full=Uncharacterized protein {ECO:0000313/EMBL:CCA72098.1} [Serendipita indica DSM 11827]